MLLFDGARLFDQLVLWNFFAGGNLGLLLLHEKFVLFGKLRVLDDVSSILSPLP